MAAMVMALLGDGNINPLKLELDLAGFNVAKTEDNILNEFSFMEVDLALFCQEVCPGGDDVSYNGAVRKGSQMHLHCLSEWLDVDLSNPHLVVWIERVMIVNRLIRKRKAGK